MEPKPPSVSRAELTDLVLPAQTNQYGTMFGGEVMSYVDRVACICASRHARAAVVTASFDSVDFLAPIRLGEAFHIRAVVTWTGRTSIEVQTVIEGENLHTGQTHVTGVCFLTCVAIDEAGKPTPVPPIKPQTANEIRQFNRGQERAEQRKRRRKSNPFASM